MPTGHDAEQCQNDAIVKAVQVGQQAISEHVAAPLPADEKPATTAKGQAQVAAVTEELAAAGITVRWR